MLAVEKVLARKTGFVYWVDMHLEVPKDMTVEEAHAVSHVVKDRIREQLPKITEVSIHVEPYPQKDLGLTVSQRRLGRSSHLHFFPSKSNAAAVMAFTPVLIVGSGAGA